MTSRFHPKAKLWPNQCSWISLVVITKFQIGTMACDAVKFSNPAEGFDCIGPDEGSDDIFFQVSAIQAAGLYELSEGNFVFFERGPPQRPRLGHQH